MVKLNYTKDGVEAVDSGHSGSGAKAREKGGPGVVVLSASEPQDSAGLVA